VLPELNKPVVKLIDELPQSHLLDVDIRQEDLDGVESQLQGDRILLDSGVTDSGKARRLILFQLGAHTLGHALDAHFKAAKAGEESLPSGTADSNIRAFKGEAYRMYDISRDGEVVGTIDASGVISTQDAPLLSVLAGIVQHGIVCMRADGDSVSEHRVRIGEKGYGRALWFELQRVGYDVSPDMDIVKGRLTAEERAKGVPPEAARQEEANLLEAISESFADAFGKYLSKAGNFNNEVQARKAMDVFIRGWMESASAAALPISWRMFDSGLAAGSKETGVKVSDTTHKLGLDYVTKHPNSVMEAVRDLAGDQRKRMAGAIKDAFAGDEEFQLEVLKKRLTDVADIGQARAELIVRTEISKVSNEGRILAWEQDPLKDDYDYFWISVADDRRKSISKVLDDNGPYDLATITDLWRKPDTANCKKHGLRGAGALKDWENDIYRQRCSLTRRVKR